MSCFQDLQESPIPKYFHSNSFSVGKILVEKLLKTGSSRFIFENIDWIGVRDDLNSFCKTSKLLVSKVKIDLDALLN